MSIGIISAVCGVKACEKRMEIAANNIANCSSAGFKESGINFSSVLSRAERGSTGTPLSPFIKEGNAFTNFTQGTLDMTGNSLDLAIEGDGFFVVNTPDGERLTRNGRFQVNAEGALCTSEGFPVASASGEIKIGDGQASIGADGTVSVNGEERGKIRLVSIDDPQKLERCGNGLFQVGGNVEIKEGTSGRIVQGAYETSNVNLVKGLVELIQIARSTEAYQKSIMIYGKIGEKMTSDVGKLV